MSINFKFQKTFSKSTHTLICPIGAKKLLSTTLKELNKKTNGLIESALKNDTNFQGKLGQTLIITLPEKSGFSKLILIGFGTHKDLTPLKLEEIGGRLFKTLQNQKTQSPVLLIEKTPEIKNFGLDQVAAHMANGVRLSSYSFKKYITPKKNAYQLKKLEIVSELYTNARKCYEDFAKITDGVFLARDLTNEPPNELYPESYAQLIKAELKPLSVDIEIIDEKKMQRLGMNAILAVGMGSIRQPRMVIMRWNGKKTSSSKSSKPIALIGKGVTFDTGGISIKPGAGMDEMKMDMGGSAAVVGAIKALALSKAKVNVIAAVGLAENMPSERAYRPGDILKSLSGKTIEVLNTDAEGRLVLADTMTYIQQKYKPHTMIDLATLTGAMMAALGHEYCGTFVNNDALWNDLEKAGTATGEKLWRMPLDLEWKKQMEGRHADLQNMGKIGRWAGACTAAGFLEHFVEKNVHWAHMDIAGTAWIKTDKPTVPKYGTGFGVRTLYNYITNL